MAILGVFVVVETIAVIRPGSGDTLSSHVWWWVGERKSGRAVQSAIYGAWLCWHFFLLTPQDVGSGILALSLAAWLIPHFYTRGRTG